MANNLVVQLLLKTGTFSTDLKTARGQVQNFQKGCQTAGKSLDAFGKAIGIDIGALTKFGGAVGIAVAAGKGLKAVIDSNQKSADFFQSAMYSAKTAVDELAYSIGTFDFSNFQDGLSGLIRRAREAAGAIDQLGNTLMSYNVIQAKARLSISQAKAIINDPNSTKEQVEEAKKVMKDAMNQMRDSASVLLDDYKTALIAEVNAKGAKMTGEGAVDILDMWLTADAMGNRDAIKKKAESDFKAYQDEVATLNSKYRPATTSFSNNFGTFSYSDDTWKNNPAYQAGLDALNKKYESAIAYNVLLNKYSDEQLQKLGQQRVAMIQTEQTLADMTTQMEKVENKTLKTTSSSTKSVKEENTALEGSLEYWKKIQQEAQKHRDMEVFNSTAWKTYDQALQNAIEHIQMLESLLKRYQNQQNGEKGSKVGIPENAPVGKAESGVTMGLNGVMTPSVLSAEQIRSHISFLEKERDTLKEGNPQIATHNKLIAGLEDRLGKITGKGVDIPSPDKKDTDKWGQFNSVMSETANIVSALASSFEDGTKLTTASILKMVSASLPALSSLIGAVAALAGVEATAKAVETSKHWIEAIAAVAALGAAVAGAISMARSQKFANGGIVGGSSFTGDRVTAQVNSGEMILNKAQQARLFKLANGGATGGQVEFHISGTELIGVLNNANRKNNLIR